MKISTTEIQRFYSENGVSAVCTSCGKQEWTIVDPPSGQQFLISSQPESGGVVFGGNLTIPLVVLVCNHCASVRMHAGILVKKYLEDHPEKKDG